MSKLIFLDVDGTLSDYRGVIPESAKKAVNEARKNGHMVFICTGRSKNEVFESILNIGFDGVVAAAGAYVEINNQVIFQQNMKKSDIEDILACFDENNIYYALQTNDGMFTNQVSSVAIRALFSKMGIEREDEFEDFLGLAHITEKSQARDDVKKLMFFESELSIDELKRALKQRFTIIPSSIGHMGTSSGELSDLNINKATGILEVCKYLNRGQEDTLAFGDGSNDFEMLTYANVGIAMGNAIDELKAVADDVTDTVSEDGIWNSFKKYQII